MNKRIACFVLSGITWAAVCNGSFPARACVQQGDSISTQGAVEPSCAEAKTAEEERHRSQLLELQKADIDATKDNNNRLLMCKADRECREEARKELDEKRRSIQAKRNEVNAEHAKKQLDIEQSYQTESRRPKLQPQQPKLDPRDPNASSNVPTTWKDAYGDEYSSSNKHVFSTPEGKQFAFPRTIEIGSDIYELDTKSFQYKRTDWGGWNATADYQNKSNPQDRTSRHGKLAE